MGRGMEELWAGRPRPPPLPSHPLGWLWGAWGLTEGQVLRTAGLDVAVYLRALRLGGWSWHSGEGRMVWEAGAVLILAPSDAAAQAPRNGEKL